MSAQDMTENKNGWRKIGELRVEKSWSNDNTVVFEFVELVKDMDGDKIVSKTTLGQWSLDTSNLPAAIQEKAMQHGFSQKFGDALAGKKEYTIQECIEILDDMAGNMEKGDWNKGGRIKSEKVKAASEEAIDEVLANNSALAGMDRDVAIALVKSLGLMKK